MLGAASHHHSSNSTEKQPAQITNIGIVKEAMAEGAYLFAELAALGARMRIIDCGGGLGIDYDGSATDAPPSIAYTMQVLPSSCLPRVLNRSCTQPRGSILGGTFS